MFICIDVHPDQCHQYNKRGLPVEHKCSNVAALFGKDTDGTPMDIYCHRWTEGQTNKQTNRAKLYASESQIIGLGGIKSNLVDH